MNKSESIGALALALSKLQGEIQNVYKDKQGYGYKYTELSSVLDVTRPLCAKYELAVTQLCGTDDKGINVETVLVHSSGEWLSSTLSMPILTSKTMSQVQGAGSSISYARRYALAALLGIAQTDNDGSTRDEEHLLEKKVASNPAKDVVVARLKKLIVDHHLEEKHVAWLEHFKVYSLDELSVDDLLKLIKKVEDKV